MTRLVNLDGDEKNLSIAGMGILDIEQLKKLDSYKYAKGFLVFWRTAIQQMRGMVKIEGIVKNIGEYSSDINAQLDKDLDRRGEIYRKAETLFREYKEKGILEMPLYVAALSSEKNNKIKIQKLINGTEEYVDKKLDDLLFALKNDHQAKKTLNKYLSKQMFDDVEKIVDTSNYSNKK